MNNIDLEGKGQDLTGNVKEGVGRATGDTALRNEGIADQIVGNLKQAGGAAREAIANPAPLVDKARGFARARPFAAAALAGVVGLALMNTLRGK